MREARGFCLAGGSGERPESLVASHLAAEEMNEVVARANPNAEEEE